MTKVHVIGAGLAGSEAAFQLAQRGIHVVLHEMRPEIKTDAHHTNFCAELVCSNSFRSDDANGNAVGLLHQEMRKMNSLIMHTADAHQVPAGGALAVDRDGFAQAITEQLEQHPHVEINRHEVSSIFLPDSPPTLVATGPLTSSALTQSILDVTELDQLAFFDAIAPIVYRDTVDLDICWFQSRYDKIGPGGDGKDYLNCPLTRDEYEHFIDLLLAGEKTEFQEWEKKTPYFEGCLPIEVMAERGRETLRYGPLKPVGLTNPHRPDEKPYAVVQLRQDNKLGTLYNLVGFQTKLKYNAQKEIFRTIPGLQQAEFARLGGIHRNTFIQSPRLLDKTLRLHKAPHIRFAGQITGVEGYVESAAMGLLAGLFMSADQLGQEIKIPSQTTAMGALLHHITEGAEATTFQPMNVNFGLFPPPPCYTFKM
jgi:methylenetetrahydrofolate--tRNA-(uracil-5-)-methyltransferase